MMKLHMQRTNTSNLFTLFNIISALIFAASSLCLFSLPVQAQKISDVYSKEKTQEKAAKQEKAGAKKEKGKLTREAQKALYECQEALKKDDHIGARQFLLDYLATQPEEIPPVLYLMLGHTWYQQENLKEAKKAFKKGYEADPSDMNLLLNYAIACFETEEFLEAAPLFEKLYHQKEKKDSKYLNQAAAAYYQGEDLDGAKRVLKELVELPGDPKLLWYELLIQICMEREEMKEAEMYVKRYLGIKPMKADYWRLLAQLRLDKDDYGGGAGALDIAYHIDLPKKKGWEDLSDLYSYLNAPIRSARSLERAYKKDKAEKGYLKIVDFYARAQRHDKAISYLDELIKEKPTASLLMEKGKRLYDAGHLRDAIKAFEECVALDSNKGEAYLIMGFVAWDLKEWARAKTAFFYAGKTRKYRYQSEDAIAILDDLMNAKYTGDNKYKRKIK